MPATPLLRRLARSGVGVPVIDLPDVTRIVVVSPHPDDESLACGGLLARAAARRIPVTILAVTDGEAAYPGQWPLEALAAVRRGEQEDAVRALGHDPSVLTRLAIADGGVGSAASRGSERLLPETRLLAVLDDLLTPSSLLVAPSPFDWHPDHEACGRAACSVAARQGCPTWSSLFWAHFHPDELLATTPRIAALVLEPHEASARRRAIRCHASQTAPLGLDPILVAQDLAHLDQPVEHYIVPAPEKP